MLEYEKEISELKNKVNELSKNNEINNNTIISQSSKLDDYQSQLIKLNNDNQILINNKNKYIIEKDNISNQIEIYKKQISDYNDLIKKYEVKVNNQKQKINKYKDIVSELEDRVYLLIISLIKKQNKVLQ